MLPCNKQGRQCVYTIDRIVRDARSLNDRVNTPHLASRNTATDCRAPERSAAAGLTLLPACIPPGARTWLKAKCAKHLWIAAPTMVRFSLQTVPHTQGLPCLSNSPRRPTKGHGATCCNGNHAKDRSKME